MRPLKPQIGLTEQVYQALADEIAAGRLAAGVALRQEQIAADLGVSRQPVQQALALLKADGFVEEHGKRGLVVTAVEPAGLSHRYDIRAALDGLAARLAAGRAAASRELARRIASDGAALIDAGGAAVAKQHIEALVQHDVAFHAFIYAQSGNPLIASTAELHWRQLRRVMGEVLRRAGPPRDIWREHEVILASIVAGDAARAEALAVAHVRSSAARLSAALADGQASVSHSDAPRPVARSPRREKI